VKIVEFAKDGHREYVFRNPDLNPFDHLHRDLLLCQTSTIPDNNAKIKALMQDQLPAGTAISREELGLPSFKDKSNGFTIGLSDAQ